MGTVYLAEDSVRDNHRLAIKLLKQEISDPFIFVNFKREFEVMSRLKHPNLARVYDFGIDSTSTEGTDIGRGRCYITMEYIEGRTLKEMLKGEPLFTGEDALSICVTLCRAIDFIHSRGILHRDLKPGNIILTGSSPEQIKVLDFGLSDLGIAEQTMVKGTVPFLAPEIFFSHDPEHYQMQPELLSSTTFDSANGPLPPGTILDERVDMYALGMTFFCILTGMGFYENESLSHVLRVLENEQVFEEHAGQALEKIHETRLRQILGRMIAYTLRERYHSMIQVVLDLNRLMQTDFPVETEPTLNAYMLGASFVGRQNELGYVRNCLNDPGSTGNLIIYKGEAGIGKSRFFGEFKKQCQLEGYQFIEAEGVRHKLYSYGLISDWLNELIYYAPTSLLEECGGTLKKLLPSHPGLVAFQPAAILEPRAERHQMIAILAEFLCSSISANNSRLVLCINDLHWADDGSLEIIELLLEKLKAVRTNGHSYPIFACARTEEYENVSAAIGRMKKRGLIIEQILMPFEASDMLLYLQATFGRDRIDQSLERAIPDLREKVGGNPYFLQELIKSLTNQHKIQRLGLFWELDGSFESGDIPDNLASIISQRIARLDLTPRDLELLRHICFLHSGFTALKVFSIVNEPHQAQGADSSSYHDLQLGLDTIRQILFSLVEQEILSADQTKGEYSYKFVHDLLREVLERQIPDQVSYHRRIARRLEYYFQHESADGLNSEAAIDELAYHFRAGGIREKAVHYLEKAADNAHKTFATHKAIAFYTQLLELVDPGVEPVKTFEIMLGIGSVHRLIGDWSQGEHFYLQAFSLADTLKLDTLSARARHEFGQMLYQKNDYERAMLVLDEARRLFHQIGDQLGTAMVLREIGSIHWRRSEFKQAMIYAQQSLDICEQLNSRRELSYALKLKGDIYTQTHDYSNALQCLEQFRAICVELDDRSGLCSADNNMGVVNLFMGQLTAAMEYYKKALTSYLILGNKLGQSIVYCNIADVYRCQEEFHLALDYIDRAIRLGRSLNVNHHLSSYLIDKARLLFQVGHFQEAQKLNQEGLEMAIEIGRKDYTILGKLYQIKIELALATVHGPELVSSATARLHALFAEVDALEEKAAISYDLWKLTGDKAIRQQTIGLYQDLANHSCKVEFPIRLEELKRSGP